MYPSMFICVINPRSCNRSDYVNIIFRGMQGIKDSREIEELTDLRSEKLFLSTFIFRSRLVLECAVDYAGGWLLVMLVVAMVILSW